MRPALPLLLILMAFSVACSGSSDGGVVGVTAIFVPDTPTPTDETTSMAEESTSGNTVIVQVNVTGTQGLASASLDVTFDPAAVEYVGHAPGDLFETLASSPPFYVATPQPGAVVLGIASTQEVDVTGTMTLIRLEFRVTEQGSFALGFDNMALNDDQPQEIPGITWSGGTLEGS